MIKNYKNYKNDGFNLSLCQPKTVPLEPVIFVVTCATSGKTALDLIRDISVPDYLLEAVGKLGPVNPSGTGTLWLCQNSYWTLP